MKRGKKANILTENVIFLVLNLLFLSLLMVFLLRQGGGIIVLEQSYAKEIALIIDSARPGETLFLNMDDAMKKAEKIGEVEKNETVKINKNIVTVRLSEKSGYSYSFFNAPPKNYYFDSLQDKKHLRSKGYFFIFSENKNEKSSN